MLPWHVLVGPAAPQGLGEGDPDPVHGGGREGTPPSPTRMAEVQSTPTYWIAARETPSVLVRGHASSLPTHSAAHGLAARVRTPQAMVARIPAASATSAPSPWCRLGA